MHHSSTNDIYTYMNKYKLHCRIIDFILYS